MRSPVGALAGAGRSLLRRPRTTAYTLVLLAVGVGLPTAMFSVLDGVVLRGLPFPEGDRVVRVTTLEGSDTAVPAGDFEALSGAVEAMHEEGLAALEEIAGGLSLTTVVTRPGLGSKGMTGTYVTVDLFDLLDVEPVRGRSFVPQDAEPGGPRVAIISHRLWRRWFGGDPEALGEKVIVNREPMTIVGVMPAGFQFPVRQEVWTPLRREGWWAEVPVFAIGKLAGGVRPDEARRALEPVATRLDQESPLPGEPQKHRRLGVAPYVETLIPPEIRRSLRLMLWAVLGVLLIACGNVASLRLGDALGRSRELAVRRALGARPGHLLRPLLAETAVLTVAGAAAGTGLAWLLVHLASETVLRGSMMKRLFWVDARLDARACLFAAGAAAVAALLGTLPPALWSLGRRDLRIGSGGGSGAGRGTLRLAGVLVVAQVAVCFVLVSASALLVESGRSLLAREPGFNPVGLLRVIVNPYQAHWDNPDQPRAFWARLLPRLEADPAIAGATAASGVPWGPERGVMRVEVRTDETPAAGPDRADRPPTALLRVLPGFFETLELPILAGRPLDPRDVEPVGAETDGGRELPVVVSASFALRHLGSRPLDEPVELVPSSGNRPPLRGRVIGIAADRSGRASSEETVYAPISGASGNARFLLVRGRARAGGGTTGAPSSGSETLVRRIDRAIAGIDPLVATLDAATYREDVAETVWVERRLAELFTLFAAASLVLSGIGLFGVAVLSLRRRARELAIRSALGAQPAALRSLLLRQGLGWIGLGLVTGAGLAWLTHRLLRAFLHGIEPWDPALTAGAAALTVLTLTAAVLGPARRAARTDPAAVLDAE